MRGVDICRRGHRQRQSGPHPQTLVSLDTDDIVAEGKRVSSTDKKVYYILNKPTGYICSNVRVGRKRIILDLFSGLGLRLFSIGRLDRDTSGLLLVTNDGHFAQKVIHPSANIVKEYLIKTYQEVTHDHLVAMSKGAFVEGVWVKPVSVQKVRKGTFKIGVMEGKKRELRVLVKKAGLDLLSLERIRLGGLHLGTLPQGMWRDLTETEKESIFK